MDGILRPRLGVPLIAVTALILGAASPASASLIYDETIVVTAQGFGAAPRILTVQTTGTESGCGANVGGSLVTGASACQGDATIAPNGVVNTGGDEATGGDNKFSIVDLGDVGVSSADQIALIYNPSQTGSDPTTNITDVTLKFYDSNNTLVASVDNAETLTFGVVNPGNGGAGFTLVLDDTQAAQIDALLGDLSNYTVALEATITNSNDGPDSFRLTSIEGATTPVPEPGTIALFGSGLLAAGLVGRRQRRTRKET
jgi:hypothetical protein